MTEYRTRKDKVVYPVSHRRVEKATRRYEDWKMIAPNTWQHPSGVTITVKQTPQGWRVMSSDKNESEKLSLYQKREDAVENAYKLMKLTPEEIRSISHMDAD